MSEHGMVVQRPSGGGNGQVVRSGFGEKTVEARRETASMVLAARAEAEIKAQAIMALQNPRSVETFRQRLLDHAKRPGFAAEAIYKKPIGKDKEGNEKFAEGPSIRFVEAALQEYSNVSIDTVIVFDGDEYQQIETSVRDLERNVVHRSEAKIPKRTEKRYLKKGQQSFGQRLNSYGDLVYLVEATDDEVNTKKGAAEAKLVRNLGRKILPPDVIAESIARCRSTMKAEDAKDPAAARRRILDSFYEMGVSAAEVEKYLGHPIEASTETEREELRGVFSALKDGDATWHDALAAKLEARGTSDAEVERPAAATAKGTAAIKERIAARAAAATQTTAAPPAPASTTPSTPAPAVAAPSTAPAATQADPPPPPAAPVSTAPATAPAAGAGRAGRGKKKDEAQPSLPTAPPPKTDQGGFAAASVRRVEDLLETLVMNPKNVQQVRELMQGIPEDNPKKGRLNQLFQDALSDIRDAEREQDDIPPFSDAEG